jgi:hypothetical protein
MTDLDAAKAALPEPDAKYLPTDIKRYTENVGIAMFLSGVKYAREKDAEICDDYGPYNWASESADIYHAQKHWGEVLAGRIRAQEQKP